MTAKLLISKKQQLAEAIAFKDWKVALSIARSFVRDFTKEEQRIIQIANECKDQSRMNFYIALGVNIQENNNKAINVLKSWMIKK